MHTQQLLKTSYDNESIAFDYEHYLQDLRSGALAACYVCLGAWAIS